MNRTHRNGVSPATTDVRAFSEGHPVTAASSEVRTGAPEFYAAYDRLREEIESAERQGKSYRHGDLQGKVVFEIGCGNEYLPSRYARAKTRVWGIDLIRTEVGLAQHRFEIEGLTEHFARANAQALPFRDGSVDPAMSAGVLHHVPEIVMAVERTLLHSSGEVVYWVPVRLCGEVRPVRPPETRDVRDRRRL